MGASTYRWVVVGSLLSSFLLGLHMPVVHEIIEHGAAPRTDVLIVVVALMILTVAGGWMLLRQAGRR